MSAVAPAPLENPSDSSALHRYSGFIELLIARGKLREADLPRLRRLAEQADADVLPALLIKLGLVSERDCAEALAEAAHCALVNSHEIPEVAPLPDEIPARFLIENKVVGLDASDRELRVAVADPFDPYVIDALTLASGKPVQVCVGLASEIDQALEHQYGSGKSAMGQIVENIEGDDDISEADVEQLKDLASEAPVIRMVNLLFQRAVESRASDIHIEPFERRLKVRLRVDGVLRDVEAPPVRSTAAVISRVKIMAKLNIAERRLPQDGRIKLQVQGKELDLRVSTVPTMHGESVVIRLLDKESIVFDFDALGFFGTPAEKFLEVLDLPHGIILITGPTGSGKSTTLYTALHRINRPERKIITVEDPVEYQLEGINQIQVKPQIGLNFSGALRAIVRQDPDVIMIGEMRDLETARIAVQSALTGHLVLSTLHTNDAAGGVTRLLDMGLEDYLIASTVNGILAQRLVRRLCPTCREAYRPLPELAEEMGLRRLQPDGELVLYHPRGCAACDGIGFRGRMAIVEFMVMSDALRALVMGRAQARAIQEQAQAEGMLTMYEDGLCKALAGQTTLDEVVRVTIES